MLSVCFVILLLKHFLCKVFWYFCNPGCFLLNYLYNCAAKPVSSLTFLLKRRSRNISIKTDHMAKADVFTWLIVYLSIKVLYSLSVVRLCSGIYCRINNNKGAGLLVAEGWSIINVTALSGAESSSSRSLQTLLSPRTLNTQARADRRERRRWIYRAFTRFCVKCSGLLMGGDLSRQSEVSESDQFILTCWYVW